ncbi:MarR family transcriptional regulator [Streptomyces sp. NPDC049916]|uniref:MarR family transcriptional regulator n=1 Tax=Streptomyces sp. NPDC049916 TaxID=3155156 RepID=UPI003446DBEE
MGNPAQEPWETSQVEMMEALREWATGFAEINLHMAQWMRLPGSDANAVGQIVWAAQSGTPLSPAALSRRIGMSTGSTAVLLNRLERAGLVVRSREHQDRRRVTLRPTSAASEQAHTFMAVAGTEIAAALRQTTDTELSTVTSVLSRMNDAARQALERLHTAGTHTP